MYQAEVSTPELRGFMVSMHGIVSKFSGKYLSIAVAIELQEMFRELFLLPNYYLELVS